MSQVYGRFSSKFIVEAQHMLESNLQRVLIVNVSDARLRYQESPRYSKAIVGRDDYSTDFS